MAKRRQGEPPIRLKNKAVRKEEYIEREKVERLIKTAGKLGRNGERDEAMCLLAFRHGLRAKEVVSMLDWHQVDFQTKEIKILRCKNSKDADHTMERDEIAALKKLGPKPHGPIFENEKGGRMSENSFFKIVQRAGIKAGLGSRIHPHMLRHACGYDMARRGIPIRHIQDWLGHKNIQHTVRYTELGADRFRKVRMW
jgi:type 1 fimbriae regulatory protein FimB/type 1 fimbriae regulatory protein FimE